MDVMKGIWLILWIEFRRSYVIFWTIILSFMMLGAMLSYTFLSESEVIMNWNTNFAVMVYLTITGAFLIKSGIHYGVAMGASRVKMYFAICIFMLCIATISAFIDVGIYFASNAVFHSLGILFEVNSLFDFIVVEKNVVNYTSLNFALFSLTLSVSLLISLLKYHFGSIFLYLLGGVLALSIFIPAMNAYWIELGMWVYESDVLTIFVGVIFTSIIIFCLPLLLIKKINVFSNKKEAL
ncbi:hypothetical protein ACM26V_22720 [Salipaludibacillus sp. HK11]|uniref:hypothetical protein n=1 Tax=Salipaludibacillus sp. HK11 TaxID=3394320 RepID=UPI0039FD5268